MELTVIVFVFSLCVVGVLLISSIRRDFVARDRLREVTPQQLARMRARASAARGPERDAGQDSFTA
ncbi:MAG TPA: hypothetical protein VF668_02485 [Pyrinomonadaceae bacterium]